MTNFSTPLSKDDTSRMALSGRDTDTPGDITKVVHAMIKERQVEIRTLLECVTNAETEEERTAAERRLDELASEWRGFPGQRRRGELLHGVNVR
jgi:hypothetical protein